MPDFHAELSLLNFILISAAVFAGAAFFAARRMTVGRSQSLMDAALLGYAVQYLAVGLPGIFHCLTPATVAFTAILFVAGFLIAGSKPQTPVLRYAEKREGTLRKTRLFGVPQDRRLQMFLTGTALFTLAIILLYAHSQASLPVVSNDAMTYQFPAAIQWLQQCRITLFQTWFFNPANTYSPLAGSMFVLWMIAPFGSDVMARFVEVPALICAGIAMQRLCREMAVRPIVSALIAAAAVLAKPIFLPSMMGKDDLFVAFFFIATLVAMSKNRSSEPYGPIRFGIALGLLLASKYTVLLVAPVLLLAVTVPRWRLRGWIIGLGIALLLAGPWYLRNWILTGNPIFPMYSLLTPTHSEAFASCRSAAAVLLGGHYGLPYPLAIALGIGWALSLPRLSDPLIRTASLGTVVGLLLFFFKAPFPEVRFVLPLFLLLFGCLAVAIEQGIKKDAPAIAAGFCVLGISLCTIFAIQLLPIALGFAGTALLIAIGCVLAMRWSEEQPMRHAAIMITTSGIAFAYAYINWQAYCRDYRLTMFDDRTGYALKYPELNDLWRFANQNIPADATVAYTNMYLIYPLQADAMQRRLIYIPTTPGVKTIADLGWLGSQLSGEKLVSAAVRATVASPDQTAWLANLRASGATYLIIGKGGVVGVPPEASFASADPRHFRPMFDGTAGSIYQFSDGP